MKPKILFDKDSVKLVLDAVCMEVDTDGYITENGIRVKDITYGEDIHVSRLGGISKFGLFKDDLLSIINIHEIQGVQNN